MNTCSGTQGVRPGLSAVDIARLDQGAPLNGRLVGGGARVGLLCRGVTRQGSRSDLPTLHGMDHRQARLNRELVEHTPIEQSGRQLHPGRVFIASVYASLPT